MYVVHKKIQRTQHNTSALLRRGVCSDSLVVTQKWAIQSNWKTLLAHANTHTEIKADIFIIVRKGDSILQKLFGCHMSPITPKFTCLKVY